MTRQPASMNAATCSIGIVTYLGRFETCFQPLIKGLSFLFPDYEINVFINGHQDIAKQTKYLREVTAFLSNYPQIRYLTNVEHQSLARGWNWLVLLSTCDNILILNDDVTFNYEFRYNLEKLANVPDIFIINGSWSHFIINKEIIRKVGWFDERFIGVGCEDHDYTFRLAMKGIITESLLVDGIWNQSSPQFDPGWVAISAIDREVGRHSQINRDFLKEKWFWSIYEPVPDKGSVKFRYPAYNVEWLVALKEDPNDMPDFYPLTCLKDSGNYHPAKRRQALRVCLSKALSQVNSYYWKFRRALRPKSRWPRLFP